MVKTPIDYRDHIGDRLDHPERVPPEYRHLIPDDQARVGWICSIPLTGEVVDIGCSDGAITRRLQAAWPEAHIVGIDKECDVRYKFLYVHQFDFIFCCEVLEHLTHADVRLALGNIYQALKPDGRLVVTVPNIACAVAYTAGCRDRWRWPDHRSAWDKHDLTDILRDTGFSPQFHALYPPEPSYDSIWLLVTAHK